MSDVPDGRKTRLMGLWLLCVVIVVAGVAAIAGLAGPREATSDATHQSSLLRSMVHAAGGVFGPLLLIQGIGVMALIVLLGMELRLKNAVPAGLVNDFSDLVNKRRFRDAFELVRSHRSMLGQVLYAGIGCLRYGLEEARRAADQKAEEVRAGYAHLVCYLLIFAISGILLGVVALLFGLVQQHFIGQGSEAAPTLTDALGRGLVVLLVGTALSLAALGAYLLSRSQLNRVSHSIRFAADDLLTQMYFASKPAAGLGPNW